MGYSKAINLGLPGKSLYSLQTTIFPYFHYCKLVPDLQCAISNEVYKEYKVLQTSALLGSGCYSAQLAEFFLLSRAFCNISYIHFESSCASASKHHLYHCIRGCNILWWIRKPTCLCPLLLLPLNLWIKSTFCYECLFGDKQNEYTNSATEKPWGGTGGT